MKISSNSLSYRNGSFEGTDFTSEKGYAVRVLNNSIAIAYSDSEDWDTAKESIDRALRKSEANGKNNISLGNAMKDNWVVQEKKKIEDFSLEDKISILKDNDKEMESGGTAVRINGMGDKIIEQRYMNSIGSDISGKIYRVSYIYVMGFVNGGNFEQSIQQFGASSGFEYIDSLNLAKRIEDDAKGLKESADARQAKEGDYDIIVGPEISGITAHESCGHPTEYDRIIGREGAQAGESFLTGKKFPYRVGSDEVSIIDDPTYPLSYGFYRYDDEGTPSRKRYLYKNGMTNEFILNRESAYLLNTESNGGGRSSSWDMEPLARMSTTYIEPGDYSFEELIEGIKHGIYIKSFTEWNIDDIRFNEKYVGKDAFYIENGKITSRVKRPTIETNTIKFYSSVDAVGKDLEFTAGTCGKGDPEQGVEVWMGGPHIRLRKVHIK
ncbi:MAG: TldD/PmbA family protein [Thermoplasmatales archaeon]|nr:TldD/PmbA family protein [Thermoplasmatales archaeon]MCW6169638.1 TldD/PmbA family protein [Thermoplasmatales archaeon]